MEKTSIEIPFELFQQLTKDSILVAEFKGRVKAAKYNYRVDEIAQEVFGIEMPRDRLKREGKSEDDE